MGVLAGDKI